MRIFAADLKPFGTALVVGLRLLALHVVFRKVSVKFFIGKARLAVRKNRNVLPFFLGYDVRRARLLLNAQINIPFGIAYLRPAVVIYNAGRSVGVNHGRYRLRCFNLNSPHINSSPLRAIR